MNNEQLRAMAEHVKASSKAMAEAINGVFFALVREARAKGFSDKQAMQMALDEMNRDFWNRNPEGKKW